MKFEEEPNVDIWEIIDNIEEAIEGPLNYNQIWGVVDKLNKVEKTAQMLIESKNFTLAAEIYFYLVEGCVNAYNRGADDSSGTLDSLTWDCITNFNTCMAQIQDGEFKDEYLHNVLELYFEDVIGLGVEKMFENIVDRDSIKEIKEAFNKGISDSTSNYVHEKIAVILKELNKILLRFH